LVLLTLPTKADAPEHSPFSTNLATIAGHEFAKCPDCAEWVKVEARICRYCGAGVRDYIQSELTSAQAEKLRSDLDKEMRLQTARDRSAAFRKSAAFKRRVTAGILAGVIAVTGVVVVVNVPRTSPWESATSECGADSGFTVDGNSITLSPLSEANQEQNMCILSQFSELAALPIKNPRSVYPISTATYKAGRYLLSAKWDFKETPDGGWAVYTLTDAP